MKIRKQEGNLTSRRRRTDNPTNVEERAEGEVKANKTKRREQSGKISDNNEITVDKIELYNLQCTSFSVFIKQYYHHCIYML